MAMSESRVRMSGLFKSQNFKDSNSRRARKAGLGTVIQKLSMHKNKEDVF